MSTAISPQTRASGTEIGKAIVMRFSGGPFPKTEYTYV